MGAPLSVWLETLSSPNRDYLCFSVLVAPGMSAVGLLCLPQQKQDCEGRKINDRMIDGKKIYF